MLIRRLAGLAILATLATAMGAESARAGDLEKLAGKWKAENVGPERNIVVVLEIKADSKFTMETTVAGTDRKQSVAGEIKLDEAAKPARIDFLKAKGVIAGKPGERDLPNRLGLYKLDGDKLAVRAGETRPQAIEGEEAEKDLHLIKFQRVK